MGIARLGWLFSDCNGVGVGRRPELCKFQLKHIDCRFQGCYFFFLALVCAVWAVEGYVIFFINFQEDFFWKASAYSV